MGLKPSKLSGHPKMKQLQQVMRELDKIPGLLRDLSKEMSDRESVSAEMIADGFESLYSRLEGLVVLATTEPT